jgi:hypothetical protein
MDFDHFLSCYITLSAIMASIVYLGNSLGRDVTTPYVYRIYSLIHVHISSPRRTSGLGSFRVQSQSPPTSLVAAYTNPCKRWSTTREGPLHRATAPRKTDLGCSCSCRRLFVSTGQWYQLSNDAGDELPLI